VTVPAAAQSPGDVDAEAHRNPSLEGPPGSTTGFGFLWGNGETTDQARTGLQGVNLGPGDADVTGFGATAAVGLDPVNPDGAFVDSPVGSAGATVGAVPIGAVDEVVYHYNVPNPISDPDGGVIQTYIYVQNEPGATTFGSSPITDPFDPSQFSCLIFATQVTLEKTEGWQSFTVDDDTPMHDGGGVCAGSEEAPTTFGEYKDANAEKTLQTTIIQTRSLPGSTWEAGNPVFVDDVSATLDPSQLVG